MRTLTHILLALAAGAAMATAAFAQDTPPQDPPGPPPEPPQGQAPGKGKKGGPRPPGMHMPMPIIAVLDKNRDGVIDEREIKKAPEALMTLDRNNDEQLTREEYLPPPPHHGPGGPGGGQGGPGGPGGPGGQGRGQGGQGGPGGFPKHSIIFGVKKLYG